MSGEDCREVVRSTVNINLWERIEDKILGFTHAWLLINLPVKKRSKLFD